MPCYVERTGFTGAPPPRRAPSPARQHVARPAPTPRQPATIAGQATPAGWSASARQASAAPPPQDSTYSSTSRLTAAVSRLAEQASLATAVTEWEREYLSRTSGHRDIVHVDANDLTYSYDATTVPTPTDNRLVAVWGRSGTPSGPRDALRMRGYPSPKAKSAEVPLDRGHAVAHSAGGSEEGINLIPQNRYLNRGWSPEGKEWTRLERQLAATLGTPFFIRPIYSDKSDFPAQIEFGVQQPDGSWDSHIFQNR